MTGNELLSNFLLPPALLVYLLLAGLLLSPWRRLSRPLIVVGILLLIVAGLPILGQSLQDRLAKGAPVFDPGRHGGLSAVVVPTGGIQKMDGGIWWPTTASVNRALEGRRMARALGLPLILTGGGWGGEGPAEALLIARVLGFDKRGRDAVELRLEQAARNSAETAANLGAHLKPGANRVLLVTSPAHRLRMAAALRAEGYVVFQPPEPLPPPLEEEEQGGIWELVLPSNSGYGATRGALYEIAGILWYLATGEIELGDLDWVD